MYVFLALFTIFHFDLEKFIGKNCKYIIFYQKFAHLDENTSRGHVFHQLIEGKHEKIYSCPEP